MTTATETPLTIKKPAVCKLLEISERKLELLVRDGDFPNPIKIGGSVRWRRETIVAWLESKDQA